MCSYRDMAGFVAQGKSYAPDLPVTAAEIAKDWVKNVGAVMASFDMLPGRSVTVRYEDLTLSPAAELGRLCRFLDLDYSESMLDFHVLNRERNLEPAETLHWKKKTLEPNRRSI